MSIIVISGHLCPNWHLGCPKVALVTGYCGVINCYCYIPCPSAKSELPIIRRSIQTVEAGQTFLMRCICLSAETGSMCAVFAHQAGLRAPPPLVSRCHRRQRRVPPPPAPAARHSVQGEWVPSSSSQNQGATQLVRLIILSFASSFRATPRRLSPRQCSRHLHVSHRHFPRHRAPRRHPSRSGPRNPRRKHH